MTSQPPFPQPVFPQAPLPQAPAPLAPARPGTGLRAPTRQDAGIGVTLAITLICAWTCTLICALVWPPPLLLVPLVVLLRTFLCTGLFITAHDAMHGLVDPGRPRVNRALGALAVFLYAGFAWRPLLQAHHQHHARPGTPEDPDFHRGDPRPLPWFLSFMRRYVNLAQLVRVALVFQLLVFVMGGGLVEVLLYHSVPALLSAVQLWWFGTFRPHRPRLDGFPDAHHARSEGWPGWATFLSCFHFGLHHTHHLAPWVPWWRLPGARDAVAGQRQG